jgi:hypothetical protein
MNPRKAATLVTIVTALAGAGTALACGGDPMPQNLTIRPAVKADLLAAYVRAHPGLDASRIAGPVRGRTYYGSIDGDRYAVVTFTVDAHLRYPAILERHDNRPDQWHVVRETHGGICGRYVPQPLVQAWGLMQWRHGECYVEP